MPDMTDVRSDATMKRRRAILEAALDCFTRKGTDATTMDDVRVASGASIGSIYHHFESKERLAAALYMEGIGEYQRGLLEEITRHQTARQGIRAAVIYHLRWIREHAAWARFLLYGREADFMATDEAALRDMNKHMTSGLRDWLARFAAANEIVELPPDTVLPLLLGPAQAFGRTWLAGRATTTIESAEEVFADAAWNAMRRAAVPER
jgi:AcrR family transcriptional regulator